MGRSRRGGRGGNDKFLRLTGLWQSKKKDNLFSGKLRNQDLDKLIEKAKEAQDNDADLMFFLWENDQESRKDPVFTLQTAVAEGDGGGRGSSRNRRDRDDDRDERRSNRDRDAEDQDDDGDADDAGDDDGEDEKKSSKSSKSDRGKSKSTSKKGKKDEDW